ncbi:UDP-glucose 4-epimerase GalE [Candidatus Woesebacteria bacterium]|nr:UDP-glucose 4-epimerase GalE [Candidatus Woesebacteria bacterium]
MIMVIGGAGYIGSHVVLQLATKSDKVVVVDNLSTGSKEALQHHETLEVVDLSDSQALERVFTTYKPETVLHFAAKIDVGESVQNPIKYYQNNTMNTLRVLDHCVRHDVKNLIFSSTAAVYGSTGNKPVKETDLTSPLSPYGWSKLMSERMIMDTAAASNLRYVILRYFNVAGSDPMGRIGQRSPKAHHLIKVCLEVALGKRDHVDVYGTDYDTKDGTGVRDYIHVMDLASAHLSALEYLDQGHPSTLFNVGYGTGYSVKEIIQTVQKVTGKEIPVKEIERRPGDSGQTIADSTKIKQLTTWKPKFDAIEQIITDAWNWEQTMVSPVVKAD